MKRSYQIPFDKEGNQQDYEWPRESQLADNYSFIDTLTYVDYSKGRSSVGFTMQRSDGRTVNVFLSEFHKWLPNMREGVIRGEFTFTKRGQNYGCVRVSA